MGWITNNGLHEGYLRVVLVDGATAASYNAHGPIVMVYDEADNYTGHDIQRADDEIIAWQLCCDCSTETSFGPVERWDGPVWQRAATPAAEDLENGRIYAPAGEASWVGDREDVDEVVRARWMAQHMAREESLSAIKRAHEEISAATTRLNEAVTYARASGRSWADIGRAAGMSRQAAHDRWASNEEPVRARNVTDFVLRGNG